MHILLFFWFSTQMFLRLNIISAGHCNIWSQESVQLEKVNPPINISWFDSTQEPRTLQWSTTTWGDEMLTQWWWVSTVGKTPRQFCIESGLVCFFSLFFPDPYNIFFYIYVSVDGMFLSLNHEAMLPHFMKCHCSVFNIQTPLPFLTPCDQEVLVPFWEKSVGAPSPTWWFTKSHVVILHWFGEVDEVGFYDHIICAMSGYWDCNRLKPYDRLTAYHLENWTQMSQRY